jgi:hypothetical protein
LMERFDKCTLILFDVSVLGNQKLFTYLTVLLLL